MDVDGCGARRSRTRRMMCHPGGTSRTSVLAMSGFLAPPPAAPASFLLAVAAAGAADEVAHGATGQAVDDHARSLVVRLFHAEGASLVRLARLFVDDREAAEDIVQEAFLRLARAAGRIGDDARAPAYLRSIVLNLARDHNRRGLVSLRHHATSVRESRHSRAGSASLEDALVRNEEHRAVLDAVRALPRRQRDCVTLRYFSELGIEAIATTLGLSPNSVKTHLQRGMAALARTIGDE